ncbi:MAG: response regulator [Nodosilinea sp.]
MAVQNSAPVSLAVRPQSPVVLVVDDDDDSLTLMAYILEHLPCETHFVADGLSALEAARQHHPHLILSDIYLPQVDGYSLIQQLRADADIRDIPVVAVTALAGQENRQKIMTAGFDDYISKPFLIERLEHLINRFISSVPQSAA